MKTLYSTLTSLTAAALLISFIAGCSTTRHATTPPDVSLTNVKVSDVSFFQTTLKVTTKIRNEDQYPVTFSGSSHRISLNGVDLGKAVSSDTIRLNPSESKEVDAEFELSHLSIASKIQSLVQSAQLKYDIDSEFYSGSNRFDRRTLRSSASGTLLQ